MTKLEMSITSTEVFDDYAELSALGGCSDYDGNEVGLDGFQVDFIINDEWRITYQSEERNNGMMNYSGWEMSTNSAVEDDYSALLNALDDDYEHEIFGIMEAKAKKLAKEKLTELKEEWLDNKEFPEEITSLGELLKFLTAYEEIDSEHKDRWAVFLLEERYTNLKWRGYELSYDDLPSFGGEEPKDTTEVWSWDDNSLLAGRSIEDFEVISRFERFKDEAVRFTVKTKSGRKGTIAFQNYQGEDIYCLQYNIQAIGADEAVGFDGIVEEVMMIELYDDEWTIVDHEN